VLSGPIKSSEQPTIGPRPPLGTVLFVTGFRIGVKFRDFIAHPWWKIHWILQVRATNAILYDCIRVILFLCRERIQHRSTTVVWLTGVQGCKPPPWQNKCKKWAPILLIFWYSVLWFSISCFFAFVGSFWTVVFLWFRVLLYRNPQPDTLSFLNFFLNVDEGPPTVASGPLSATFPTLVKSSSYTTGLQLNFPE